MSLPAMVSIITPFLNAERFIQEAIESVLAQTYLQWELLLVDDGSADRGSAVARRYARRHPERIRYLEHDGHANRGKSLSRNLGIAGAIGEYVTFLDADDVLLPQKLERRVAMLDARPDAAMVYGPAQYWYSWTGDAPAARRDRIGRLGLEPDTLYHPPQLLTRFLQAPETVPCLCSLLVRRSLLEAVGGFEEAVSDLYEDQVLLAKICLRSSVYVAGEYLERYRQHPDSASAMAMRAGTYHPLRPNPARLAFLSWLDAYVAAERVDDARLRNVLERALWPYRHPTLQRVAHASRDVLRLRGALGRRVRRLRKRMAPKAVILMYHRIGEAGADPWALRVSPRHFAEHLDAMRRHARPTPLRALTQRHRNGDVPPAAVVVTFDDGYADNLHYGKGLLERYEVPATVFLTTGVLGFSGEFWWDELERLLLQPGILPEVLSVRLGGSTYEWDLGPAVRYGLEESRASAGVRPWDAPPGSRLGFYYSVWKRLLPLPEGMRAEALAQIRSWARAAPPARVTHRPLSLEELAALDNGGLFEFGAHTVTHPFLPAHPLTVQVAEISGSKAGLEDILGRPVTSFAYPHGAYADDTLDAVRRAGFACACSVDPGTVWHLTDRYRFPRYAVEDWPGDEFTRRLTRWLAS